MLAGESLYLWCSARFATAREWSWGFLQDRGFPFAIVVAALLIAGSFAFDSSSAFINVLTEAAGVAVSTALTVGLIEARRRRREADEEWERRRRRLSDELAVNLAEFVHRLGHGAFNNLDYLAEARPRLDVSLDHLFDQRPVLLSREDAMSVARLVTSTTRGQQRHAAIDDAIADGVFLADDAEGVLVPTPMHDRLRQLREAIDSFEGRKAHLRQLAVELLADLDLKDNYRDPVPANAMHLATALGYYDAARDLFNESVAVLRVLQKIDTDPIAVERQPLSPFGTAESTNIRAQTVVADEVLRLLRHRIYPFGNEFLADPVLWDTPEEHLALRQDWMAALSERLREAGYDTDRIEQAVLESAVDAAFQALRPTDEGIEHIRRADRDESNEPNADNDPLCP